MKPWHLLKRGLTWLITLFLYHLSSSDIYIYLFICCLSLFSTWCRLHDGRDFCFESSIMCTHNYFLEWIGEWHQSTDSSSHCYFFNWGKTVCHQYYHILSVVLGSNRQLNHWRLGKGRTRKVTVYIEDLP